MRIYSSCIVAADELARELREMGIVYQSDTVQDKYVGDNPEYQTLELMGYSYCLQNYSDLEELLPHMGMDKDWVKAEINDRLNFHLKNKNPGEAWLLRKDFWEPYLRNGFFSYSYPERWQAQIPYIIQELISRPNTRQAILSFYESTKDMMNWGGNDRVPCSLTYQFLIRDNMLHIIYNQRSCDYTLFYASDVYTTIKLMQYVAKRVGVEPGYFYHMLGSLHTFKANVKDQF